jgi:hypothetical protein
MLHTSLRTIRAANFAAADAAAAEEDAASDAASAHADEDVDMQPAAAPLRLVLGLSAEQMLQAERSERLLTALRDARTVHVCGWLPDVLGRDATPVYRIGAGAPEPRKKLTRAEISKRFRERNKDPGVAVSGASAL